MSTRKCAPHHSTRYRVPGLPHAWTGCAAGRPPPPPPRPRLCGDPWQPSHHQVRPSRPPVQPHITGRYGTHRGVGHRRCRLRRAASPRAGSDYRRQCCTGQARPEQTLFCGAMHMLRRVSSAKRVTDTWSWWPWSVARTVGTTGMRRTCQCRRGSERSQACNVNVNVFSSGLSNATEEQQVYLAIWDMPGVA
jgi:hypothetical protein